MVSRPRRLRILILGGTAWLGQTVAALGVTEGLTWCAWPAVRPERFPPAPTSSATGTGRVYDSVMEQAGMR